MRAAVRTRYGLPEVVRVVDVPAPTARSGEVLVKVVATTVNRTDCAYRSGRPAAVMRPVSGVTGPRAQVLGTEFAGVVVAIGETVSRFRTGDRVFGYVEGRFGAHAEFMTVPEKAAVATIPADLTFEQVVPGTEGPHYALAMVDAARVAQGHAALVNGATGAIGSAAVQLLRSRATTVTAVCGPEHRELVMALGADRVIDRTREDFTQDDATYDLVLDCVGKSSFGRCRRLLSRHGLYISTELGPFWQNPLLALATALSGGRRVRFPLPRSGPEVLSQLRALLQSGELRPVVDRTYPLERIVEAYRYVETGQKVGSVVIRVAGG